MLRSFMRRARVATYWASSAMIVSSPFALYMDFDLSKSPPGWAVASFVVGSLGFYLLLVLIPARILGRVILFVLGDGTSRIDVWLRLGFVILIPAIIAGAITVSVMERRDPSPALTIVTVTPTTIPTASVTSPPAP